MVHSLSNGIITGYEETLKSRGSAQGRPGMSSSRTAHLPMTQARALQMMFDVKFLSAVLPTRDDTEVM